MTTCVHCKFAYTEAQMRGPVCASCRDILHQSLGQLERLEEPNADGTDLVNHPAHYTGHASGIECIQITEHMNFCIGNAIKYLWRADEKGDPIENLRKAAWYIAREIDRRVSSSTKRDT